MNDDLESNVPAINELSEQDVERLLVDAYGVPPVPAALRRRLDASIAEQWGESEAVRWEPRGSDAGRSRRLLGTRMWPVAAAAVLIGLLILAVRPPAYAYTWQRVVEALSQQAVVQIRGAGATGESAWMSFPAGKLGRQAAQVATLQDPARGMSLERDFAVEEVRQYRVVPAGSAPSAEEFAIALLLHEHDAAEAFRLAERLRVADQNWQRAGDDIELQVKLRDERDTATWQLTLTVDPRTALPRRTAVRTPSGEIQEGTVHYPRVAVQQWIAESFPAHLPVVEVAGRGATAEASSPDRVTRTPGVGRAKATVDPPAPSDPNARVLTGAATLEWAPLSPTAISHDDSVARIDALLQKLWQEQQISPVAAATDAELLRRVYLDLAGRTPTVAEARRYLQDTSPDRYARLVERLLASPDHASHLATVWRTALLPEGVDLTRFGGVPAFDAWLSDQFQKNVGYDELVRELLLAEGRLAQSGPLLFYSAAKLDAEQLAARTSRVFLGMRLECAQCHDDPFEPWTQRDFWSYAAFFARISRPQAALESVSTVMRVKDIERGEVTMPDSTETVAPQFLDGSAVQDQPTAPSRREQLARWLTAAENPYFARAAVNRVWAQLFGRGIVDPVDGFGKRNPPRSPELLDLLASQFVANEFNLRETFRTIVMTRAYRLASGAESDDPARREWFAQMNVKMLTAEQLYDCITVASMLVDSESAGFRIARVGNANRDTFLREFQALAGKATEYEGGIPQALTLMNGSLISSATDLVRGGLLKSLEAPFFNDDQRVEVIYLATLSRRPTEREWALLRQHMQDRDPQGSVQGPLADILWAVLNSAEFTMNH